MQIQRDERETDEEGRIVFLPWLIKIVVWMVVLLLLYYLFIRPH